MKTCTHRESVLCSWHIVGLLGVVMPGLRSVRSVLLDSTGL